MDFVTITSAYLHTRVPETHLTVHHNKMTGSGRIRVTDEAEWKVFIDDVAVRAGSAYTRAVELDVFPVRVSLHRSS